MSQAVNVVGVGMIPFTKPGQSDTFDVMGQNAARAALDDAGISYQDVGHVYAGYIYADSCAGQAAVYPLGLSGVPVFNVNNNCATGSSALFLARQAVASGVVECALALGFEQMMPGMLGAVFEDRPGPGNKIFEQMVKLQGYEPKAPPTAQLFGGAAREYSEKYGTQPETFARISEKARKHAVNNPYAVFRDPLSLDQIMQSPQLYGVLTRYQSCPPTCGAAAAVICSEAFAKKHGLESKAVSIKGQAMTTDQPGLFDSPSMMQIVGYDMAKAAADSVYDMAGIGPDDIDVVELHDCFSANELISYESLGLTPEGGAEQFIMDGNNTYGGKVVVNPSGGLLSKGHPLGATGLAQCAELVWQLRGDADKRQVSGARHALQHNLGIGGACVVTLYGRD